MARNRRGRQTDESSGQARRKRNRIRRSQKYGGGPSHKTRVCPDCKAHIPYVEGVTGRPSTCPTCGHRFECPECGVDIAADAAVCSACETVLDEDAPDPQTEFTWSD